MNCKINVAFSFKKEAKHLQKHYASFKEDYVELIQKLTANPESGVSLGRGLRKVRMNIRSKGKGQRGGARVITFTVILSVEETEINLLYIYDKSERSSITEKELNDLLKENGFCSRCSPDKKLQCDWAFYLFLYICNIMLLRYEEN